jgi:hypothetical protein
LKDLDPWTESKPQHVQHLPAAVVVWVETIRKLGCGSTV